jgi:hypothetical protein
MAARFDTVKINTNGPNVVCRNCMAAFIVCFLSNEPVLLSEFFA